MRTVFAFSVSLLLAACGGESATVETEDGTAEYELDDGEAEIRFTDGDGQETVITSGSGGDAVWPEGFTLYPGASVESNVRMRGSEDQGDMITISTTDSAEDVLAHYRQEAEAAGIEIQMEMRSGDTFLVGGESEDGVGFSVNVTTQDGQTTAMIIAGGQ